MGERFVDADSISNSECQKDVQFWTNSLNSFLDAYFTNCSKTNQTCNDRKAELVAKNLFAAKRKFHYL